MKLAVFVLNNQDLMPQFLEELYNNGINGGTILESKGMARKMIEMEDDLFSIFRDILVSPNESNKTFLFCLQDKQVQTFKDVCNRVTGGLENPNTGILILLPVDEIEGSFMKNIDEDA